VEDAIASLIARTNQRRAWFDSNDKSRRDGVKSISGGTMELVVKYCSVGTCNNSLKTRIQIPCFLVGPSESKTGYFIHPPCCHKPLFRRQISVTGISVTPQFYLFNTQGRNNFPPNDSRGYGTNRVLRDMRWARSIVHSTTRKIWRLLG
jgi:hypothetical protein